MLQYRLMDVHKQLPESILSDDLKQIGVIYLPNSIHEDRPADFINAEEAHRKVLDDFLELRGVEQVL